jgi:hypothetical protein
MNKVAAIWARVSDPKQEEPSVDRQVATVKAWLEEQGYSVPSDKIIKVVWTSKKILNCPDMQRLLSWVKTGEVKAVGMTHLDRLSGRPGHMSQIFETLKDANCQLLAKDTPLPTGLMGEMVALVMTLGKAMQVDKADNGAKQGLRDRVERKRLPTSKHRVYGYQWASDNVVEPDHERPERYEARKLMCDMAVKGATYFDIQKELRKQGVLSPSGNPEWDRSSIALIVNDPINGGRYYALKHEACEPKKRKVAKEGNTSSRYKSLDEAVYLPEVKVIDPPITWEQYLQLQARHQVNQKLASRNGKREYLLRGFIKCYTHHGKKGEPRTYYGRPNGNSYIYACPVGGCAHPNLHGPRTEDMVKQHTRWLLNRQPEEFYRYVGDRGNKAQTRESLENEKRNLESKYNRNVNAETELEKRDLSGQVHPEVYRRLKSSYQAERLWIDERKETIEQQLAQLEKQADIADTWWKLRERVAGRIDQLTSAEWREIFITLNLQVSVRDRENPDTWHQDWYQDENGALVQDDENGQPREVQDDVEIWFGIPTNTERADRVGEIVFGRPCPSPSS